MPSEVERADRNSEEALLQLTLLQAVRTTRCGRLELMEQTTGSAACCWTTDYHLRDFFDPAASEIRYISPSIVLLDLYRLLRKLQIQPRQPGPAL